MIIEIILLQLLDGARSQQVCHEIRVVKGLYRLCRTIGFGAVVQLIAVELLFVLKNDVLVLDLVS